jgi:hypothetical protein
MRFQNSEDVQIFRILIRIDGWEGSPIMALDRRRLEANDAARQRIYRPVLSRVEVIRAGRVEPFLCARPALTSAVAQWRGLAVEDYRHSCLCHSSP